MLHFVMHDVESVGSPTEWLLVEAADEYGWGRFAAALRQQGGRHEYGFDNT